MSVGAGGDPADLLCNLGMHTLPPPLPAAQGVSNDFVNIAESVRQLQARKGADV